MDLGVFCVTFNVWNHVNSMIHIFLVFRVNSSRFHVDIGKSLSEFLTEVDRDLTVII